MYTLFTYKHNDFNVISAATYLNDTSTSLQLRIARKEAAISELCVGLSLRTTGIFHLDGAFTDKRACCINCCDIWLVDYLLLRIISVFPFLQITIGHFTMLIFVLVSYLYKAPHLRHDVPHPWLVL